MSRAKGAGGVAVYTDDKAALRLAVGRSEKPLSATELVGAARPERRAWAAVKERLRRAKYRAAVYARQGLDAAGRGVASTRRPHDTTPAPLMHREVSHER